MTEKITINLAEIDNLDLSHASRVIDSMLASEDITVYEQQLQFQINYERETDDPRELSEIPEVRLWFVRLDATYPWLPFFLDAQGGELARYTAMLVPHQFSRSEGIQYNPEALEIFVMEKIFVLHNWLAQKGIPSSFRLKGMAQLLGYAIDDSFFEML